MQIQDAMVQSGIRLVPCHSEQAAAVAAEYWGRRHAAGCGVVLVTTGPGITNTLTPAVSSWLDSRPLIIIAGQIKTTDLIMNNSPIRHYGVQYVDSKNIFKPICKTFHRISSDCNISNEFDALHKEATTGRQGTAILEIPIDLQSASGKAADSVRNNIEDESTYVEDYVNSTILPALGKAKRPLLLLGSGVVLCNTPIEEINKLVSKLDIPVCNSWGSIATIDDDNRRYMGRPGVVGKRAANFAVQNCDLLIAIGNRLDLITTAYNPPNFAKSAKDIFVIDIDENELMIHKELGRHTLSCSADMFIRILQTNISERSIECGDGTSEWKDFCYELKEAFNSEVPQKKQLKLRRKMDGQITY